MTSTNKLAATVSTERARRAWDDFEGSLRKSLAKAIELGKALLDIKEKCGHGGFGRYFSDHADKVEGALPFRSQWARRLMTMASNEAVANRQHAVDLPNDLQTVYELATMTAPALEAAIAEGKVTPETTRAEAKAIKREAEPGGKPAKERKKPDEAHALSYCRNAIERAVADALEAYPHLRAAIASCLRLIEDGLSK